MGSCRQQRTGCTWGGHSPPGTGSCPTVQPQSAPSLLFLWVPPRSLCPGRKLVLQGGRAGAMGLLGPHTSHLPTLALGTWPLLSLAGTGPILTIRPEARVPGAASVSLCHSSASRHLPSAPQPLPESWRASSGVRVAGGACGATPPVLGGLLLLGTPLNQGHLGAREPGGPPRKRARWDPPSPAPA